MRATAVCLALSAAAVAGVVSGQARLSPAGASWTSIGPDGGAVVSVLAVDPKTRSTIYAGTSRFAPQGPSGGSVYRSVDSGASWTLSSAGLPSRVLTAFAIDPTNPSVLYAGTPAGVFRSPDAAQSWTAANSGLTDIGISALAADPATPGTLYAATPSGVFKSVDGAATWTAANLGLQGLAVQELAIDPANSSTLYAGTGTGVYRSPDGAASWTPAGNFPTAAVLALSIASGAPSAVYAGVSGDLLKSVDLGITWQSAKGDLAPGLLRAVAAGPASTGVVYASVDGGAGSTVFRTADGGVRWAALSGGPASVAVLAIDPVSAATIYAGGVGVSRSADSGASWATGRAGMREAVVNAAAIVAGRPDSLYAATSQTVYGSRDGGRTWLPARSGLPNASFFAVASVSSTTIYTGTTTGVFRSTDGGATWSPSSVGLDQAWIVALAPDPTSPSTLYAGSALTYLGFGIYTGGGVFKSVDAGATWTAAGLGGILVSAVAVDPSSPQTVYAGSSLGVFRSLDAGTTWTTAATALSGKNVTSLALDGRQAGALYAATADGLVFKTSDSAGTWAATAGAPSSSTIRALLVDPRASSTLYAATYSGVWRSTDAGATWVAINDGLTSLFVLSLAIDPADPTILYAGTDGGSAFARTLTVAPPRAPARAVGARSAKAERRTLRTDSIGWRIETRTDAGSHPVDRFENARDLSFVVEEVRGETDRLLAGRNDHAALLEPLGRGPCAAARRNRRENSGREGQRRCDGPSAPAQTLAQAFHDFENAAAHGLQAGFRQQVQARGEARDLGGGE